MLCFREGLCIRVRHVLLNICRLQSWLQTVEPWKSWDIAFEMSGSLLDGTSTASDFGVTVKAIFRNLKVGSQRSRQNITLKASSPHK